MAWLPLNVGAFMVICLLFCLIVDDAAAVRCNRFPKHVNKRTKTSGDGGYRILIDGNPNGYQPGKIYNGKSSNSYSLRINIHLFTMEI